MYIDPDYLLNFKFLITDEIKEEFYLINFF